MKFKKSTSIKTSLGTYHRALETPNFIFYVNYEEGDENGCVMMYNRKMKLVSNNYLAYGALFEALEKGEYSWISKEMKENVILHNEVVEESEKIILRNL